MSPTVHRLALEMSERQASALALAIAETDAMPPEVAKQDQIANGIRLARPHSHDDRIIL